jgi:hypothetical protein
VRAWGVAAFEAGRPLLAYIRLRQYLAREPQAVDRLAVEDRIARSRDALLTTAARFSRVLAWVERRPDATAPGERYLARIAARDQEVSAEGLIGPRIDSPVWRRAEEIQLGPYLDMVRRLLETPAMLDESPPQAFDANAPGPRRAAVVRLVIGEEERRLEALRDLPLERLSDVVGAVIEFVRTAPKAIEAEAPAAPPPPAPPPPKPSRKRG